MRFSSLLPAVLVGAAVAAPAAPAVDEDYMTVLKRTEQDFDLLRRQIPSKPCSAITGGLHLLVLGGANSPDPKTNGKLQTLSNAIMAAIPGSSNVSVPYNKVFMSQNPPKLYPNAVPDGMALLKQYTVQYHHACPNTKMAIIGYSSGAVIMMNDLCYGGNGQGTDQLNPLLSKPQGTTPAYIIGQVAYGDETFVSGQSYNRGTCTSGHGTAPRSNPGLCEASGYGANLASYCDSGDPDCCIGQGTQDVSIHLSYPGKYDSAAAQFILEKWNAAGKNSRTAP